MYCKFEYTERYKKLNKVLNYIYYAYVAFLVLVIVNNYFIKIVEMNVTLYVSGGLFAILLIIEGLLDFYKTKCISLPNIEFTLQYDDINQDDPLQRKVVSQAVSFATSWADFALKREIKKITINGIYELGLGVLDVLLLIMARCYQ